MENYIVSARKYRPMTFRSVVGQEALTTTLRNTVKSGKLAHAYLFCGPRGVGKTTCARIFAKAINCMNPTADGEACNECESCRAMNEGRSMNIFELDAASNNSVENIRQLMEQTQIPPQIGRYKVFIIDEVHMLSTAAFNAFLKTLEEPPAHVIFILATTEKHKILPTILSRCQIYDFERMRVPDIIKHLEMVAGKEGIEYEPEALSVIAEKADGGMRDALSIFDQVASFSQGKITYQKVIEDLNVLDAEYYFRMVDLAIDNKVPDMMLLLNKIVGKGFDPGLLVDGLASHLRNVLMARDASTLPLLEASDQMRQRYQEQAKRTQPRMIYRALKLLNDCDLAYRQSSNKRLLVELTLIQVAQLTQPDDDAAGAGRSPKRLKSLFKQIAVAQPKPALQVAGGGRAKERTATRPSSANDAPTTTSPITASGIKPATVPQAPDAPTHPSLTPPTVGMPKGFKMKLSGLGPSFKQMLQKTEEKKENQDAPILAPEVAAQALQANTAQTSTTMSPAGTDAEEAPTFTDNELRLQWMLMCNRMQQQERFLGLSLRLKNITPEITDYPNIEVVADNKSLLAEMTPIRDSIEKTLQITLHCPVLRLTLRLADEGEARRFYTKREIFDQMRQKNPALEKLRLELGLELA